MTRYVCGFLFAPHPTGTRVLLAMKLRPEWQRGRWNGLGGHVNGLESDAAAMQREFEEESGTRSIHAWEQFCALDGENFNVAFFRAFTTYPELCAIVRVVLPVGAERIILRPVAYIDAENSIPNLTWLVPMALNHGRSISPRPESGYVVKEVYP
jgi:8-oxo-dGTP diphosphatase